jgi:enterochelin esterase family protein
MSTTKTGPVITDTSVRFWLADPSGQVASARLYQEVLGEHRLLDMARHDGGFELWLDRPAVHRMEYAFDITRADGSTARELDPDNDGTVDGVFGHKSVLEFPGYQAPRWLDEPAGLAEQVELPVESERLGTIVPVRLWQPSGAEPGARLPLLVVHDGVEFDTFSSITTWAAAAVNRGWVPPFRMALLHPVERIEWFSANPAYAGALIDQVLPAISSAVAVTGRPALTGASLGALAALHAHLSHPGAFAGLFLQSGSFFTDLPEGREESLRAIPPFVADVHAAALLAEPVPAVLTVGVVERNRQNVRHMAETLAAQGYDVQLHEMPDGHNYTAWRDAFDPHLTELLARLWGKNESTDVPAGQ